MLNHPNLVKAFRDTSDYLEKYLNFEKERIDYSVVNPYPYNWYRPKTCNCGLFLSFLYPEFELQNKTTWKNWFIEEHENYPYVSKLKEQYSFTFKDIQLLENLGKYEEFLPNGDLNYSDPKSVMNVFRITANEMEKQLSDIIEEYVY